MFHVISARLSRLVRKIAVLRDGQVSEYASWHGWTVTRVSPGTWRYRDPRFDLLSIERSGLSSGCADCDFRAAERIADARYDNGRTWSHDVLAGRIRALDLTVGDTGSDRRRS